MRVDRLYRYPVKGLTAEALESAAVAAGGGIPWDRAFALAQGDCLFDPAAPAWRPKTEFMCLRVNARIALLRASFDARHGRLTLIAPDGAAIEENVLTEPGGSASAPGSPASWGQRRAARRCSTTFRATCSTTSARRC
jgi:uncharacterized protein YcbX